MNCTVCRQTIHQTIPQYHSTLLRSLVGTVTFHSGQDSSKTFFTPWIKTHVVSLPNCGLLEFKSPSSQGSTVNKAGLGDGRM